MPSPASSQQRLSSQILVDPDETPARRLVLKMLDLQEHLTRINRKVISGVAVSEEDWFSLRVTSNHLAVTMNEEVVFSLEVQDESPNEEAPTLYMQAAEVTRSWKTMVHVSAMMMTLYSYSLKSQPSKEDAEHNLKIETHSIVCGVRLFLRVSFHTQYFPYYRSYF
jgi:hypothetical protein